MFHSASVAPTASALVKARFERASSCSKRSSTNDMKSTGKVSVTDPSANVDVDVATRRARTGNAAAIG